MAINNGQARNGMLGKGSRLPQRVDPLLAWCRSASDFAWGCCYQRAIRAYRKEGGRNQEKGRREQRGLQPPHTKASVIHPWRQSCPLLPSCAVSSPSPRPLQHWSNGVLLEYFSSQETLLQCRLRVMRVTTYLQSHTCLQSSKPHILQEPSVSLP